MLVYITTLSGNLYEIEYTDYRDLSLKIHAIHPDFHPNFQRLVRDKDDNEKMNNQVFPAGLGQQPVLVDGEHVRLLMVNTVWTSVDSRRHDYSVRYVCSFGHSPNENGMWQFELHPSDCRNSEKLLQTIRDQVNVAQTGWPNWHIDTVIESLFEKVQKYNMNSNLLYKIDIICVVRVRKYSHIS